MPLPKTPTQTYLFRMRPRACLEARRWVGTRTLRQAWRDCHRADWMAWLVFFTCTYRDEKRLAPRLLQLEKQILKLTKTGGAADPLEYSKLQTIHHLCSEIKSEIQNRQVAALIRRAIPTSMIPDK